MLRLGLSNLCILSLHWTSVVQYVTLLSHSPVAVDCGGLPDPTNGQVDTPSGTTFNNTAIYSCDPGYNLNGSMIRTCGVDGSWTPNAPTCDRKLCNTFCTELVM